MIMTNQGWEIFRSHFYAIDFFIGSAAPVVVYLLYRSRRIGRFIWFLFWIGFGLGLCWEVPMQVLNQMGAGWEVHRYVRPPPVHFSAIILSHSFWDGGLFLLGVWLVRRICGAPIFERFKPSELLVLIAWGQASELWVELTSISGQAWSYVPRPWNPALFHFQGQPLTLLPQLIWLAAPVIFYFIAVLANDKLFRKKPKG